ncbi:MAG: endonuclease/exonuclease/phosphatase family protein [Actinomycetota bacterium]|nr:endonuclease/exonuclease/phosphatase family protein [Acidimicrobiia bacterium]MDQ3147480.1 endonuclease/exonuclease/phosphatase family protein [Actinomycetota bacterium]
MRLVTWNILHGRRQGGRVDRALLQRSCAALRADVLGLQEVDVGTLRVGRADLVADVAEAAEMESTFASVRSLAGGGRVGNALLVRGRLLDSEVLPLPGREGTERRCAAVATAELTNGTQLSVAVCHLGIRGEGSSQLSAVIAALAERPGPHVLLGDLNLRPAKVAPTVESAGFRLVGGDLTFPADHPDRRIDHVALAGLAESAVVTPLLPVSDHRALVVEAAPPGP